VLKRVLGRVFIKLASLLGIPETQSRLDMLESRLNELDMAESRLNELELVTEHSDRRTSHFERFIDRRVTEQLRDLEVAMTQLFKNDIAISIDELSSQLARHRRYVDNLQLPSRSSSDSNSSVPTQAPSSPEIIDDALYMALEDAFRGSYASIQARQSQYLHLLESYKHSSFPLLDIGCGRGEWLGLLKSQGFNSYGIDTNSAAVNECQSAGLDVKNSDLISHLESLPDESLSCITMFQVLEHLPFNMILKTMKQIRRVLVPGGLFIGEIPNSQNLLVAASNFWIDPTHQRPLHPLLLKFLATECGFSKVDGIYSTRLSDMPNLDSLPKDVAASLSVIFDLTLGDADFALTTWV
jgi:SAM-dependent methyltransferase